MWITLALILPLLAGVAHQAAVPSYEVEVYFVVDRAVVDRYVAEQTNGQTQPALESLNADIDYFLTEINGMYASLEEKGFNIRILKKKVDILDVNLFYDNTDVDPGLKAFDAWLLSTGAYASINYDAAILWTGFELVSGYDAGVAGYAHVGEICKTVNSSGIAEYDLTYSTSITTAHELAHIMGAGHDSDITGYIMVPKSSAVEENRWKFSLCTKEAFDAAVGKLSSNCLLSSSAESTAQAAGITDALGNPDTVCRRSEQDQNSYMCKSPAFYDGVTPQGDTVCKRIWCKETGTSYCNSAFSSDGLICGTNKRCNDGKCEDNPDSESALVTDECIWGDQASVSFSTSSGHYEGDCPGLIDFLGKSACGSATVETTCCKTCEDLHTGIEGCEYGDTFDNCNAYTQRQICDNYRDICCEFCHGYRKKRSADSDGKSSKLTLDLPPGGVKVTDDLQRKPDSAPNINTNGGPREAV
ncbi:hypothetical protein RRG08_029278 [Elysia crispata]|uniref:Peptidase M12B domain-containing protein n=1 Tax=Elysia crispata TaxID=231223 RepID=A0AAE1A5C8_9GAST|nr:hypothetical protein RRG08_029278 [Elysia crispata]